jgi:hypothetical protein
MSVKPRSSLLFRHSHDLHLISKIIYVVLFTVEGRGELKRCFSCTRTGADSFLLVWWKGGVERNGVSLPHAPEPNVLSTVAGRGGENRCIVRTRIGGHSIFV